MIPSLISGILLGCAFPLRIGTFVWPNCGWLAWVGLVPLFLSLRMATPGQAFRRTFVAAFIAFSLSLYWLYTALHHYGGLNPPLSILLLILTMMIVSTFISMAAWLTRWIAQQWEYEPLWLLPAAWVVGEFARNYQPFGGFPWSNVAETQYAYLPLIQITDVTGIYGLIFLIVWTNRWLAHVCARVWRGGLSRQSLGEGGWQWREPATCVTVGLWVLCLGYGTWRFVAVKQMVDTWPGYNVALLQGNIPQEEKWRPGMAEENLAQYATLLHRLVDAPVDLVVWPEASYPYAIPVTGTRVKTGDKVPAHHLLGALGVDGSGPTRQLFNSVFLLDPNGHAISRYDKTHLVPFGEYVPYQSLFAFARRLAAPIGDYVAGSTIAPLQVGTVAIGPLICYEDTFPEVARAHARRGARFFANVTNDAWYGWSGAAEQHVALSVFRAVENRRYLVRATNTGVSGIIDPMGRRIIRSRLFEPAVIVGHIRLGSGETLYTIFGDWFAFGCGIALCGAIILARRRHR